MSPTLEHPTQVAPHLNTSNHAQQPKPNTPNAAPPTPPLAPASKKPLAKLFKVRLSLDSPSQDVSDAESIVTTSSNFNSFALVPAPILPTSRIRSQSSRLRARLKMASASSTSLVSSQVAPDLRISTASHHSLKVPKKILLANLIDENSPLSSRKISLPSPANTLHSFFHRNHTVNPDQDPPISIIQDEMRPLYAARTLITLSSNNSNSCISDVRLAMLYHFTDPSHFSTEEPLAEPTSEHSSLADFHRKLMIPTDQYLQQRATSQPRQSSEFCPGLGIAVADQNEPELSTTNASSRFPYKRLYLRFFRNLEQLTLPLLASSQYRRMPNGRYAPLLGCMSLDVASYVRSTYINPVSGSTNLPGRERSNSGPMMNDVSKLSASTGVSLSRSSSISRAQKVPALKLKSETRGPESSEPYSVQEMAHDVRSYFSIVMKKFHNDQSDPNNAMPEANDSLEETVSAFLMSLMQQWTQIAHLYTLFNSRIRYTILECLQPIQRYWHQQQSWSHSRYNATPSLDLENMLLLAFRDAVIVPNLMQRLRIYVLALEATVHDYLLYQEEQIFLMNEPLHRTLVGCFGVIHSCTHAEPGTTDGEQYIRNDLFTQTYSWLDEVNIRAVRE